MTKRLVDIDDELLARARAELGVATIKDTVNGALRGAVAEAARRRDLERLRAGLPEDFGNPEVLASAWR